MNPNHPNLSHPSHAAFSRRAFLKTGASLAALSALGAQAATAGDYKALVCLWLAGGNDGNNLIVPLDSPWDSRYATARGALALSGSQLSAPFADSAGQRHFALHHGLPRLRARHGNGLAFVLNAGVLDHPLTRGQYLAGDAPPTLFSHSDQAVVVQSGKLAQDGTGWGGRLLDVFGAAADRFASISSSTPATLLQGYQVAGNVIPPGAIPGSGVALEILNQWDRNLAQARSVAVNEMLAQDGGNPLRAAANRAMRDGLKLIGDMQAANLPAAGSLGFPQTYIGQQLEQVARIIAYRSRQGPGRQVFICTLGGFDTHSAQDWAYWNLLSQVDSALDVFLDVMAGPAFNLAQQVTAFSQSEFGRSLQPSGTGSDHGWGNHHFVAGGAVRNGVYGAMPDFLLGGQSLDDCGARGVWIPRISQAQFAATLGKWFGASPGELAFVFPELANFAGYEDLGFMW